MYVPKELKRNILSEINKIDIIDPHTHLKEDSLTSHVVDILSYHWVLSELNSVGLDYQKVFSNPEYSLEERLKAALPYIARMKNTATWRCVRYIFEDLYDFHEELDEHNYKRLLNISLEKTAQKDWASQVFHKANIKRFITGCGNASKLGNERPDFNLMAEVNYLNWPAGSTDNLPWFGEFALDETRYLDALEHIGGAPVNAPSDIDRALDKFLHEALTGRCKVFASYLPIEFRYMPADAADCASAIARFRAANGKDPQALQTLTHYVNWKLLEIMNDIGCTLQTAVGAEYFICGGRSLSRYSDTWVSDMVKVCYQFPNIEFDFMNASQAMNHEMEVAAKMIRNFHIQNMWWHTYVPGCMQSLSEKLEVVPAVKLGGFFCDAYYCELTYGKLQMVKDTLANVFADKVASGLYTEDYAVEVLKMLLNENQRALYRLD